MKISLNIHLMKFYPMLKNKLRVDDEDNIRGFSEASLTTHLFSKKLWENRCKCTTCKNINICGDCIVKYLEHNGKGNYNWTFTVTPPPYELLSEIRNHRPITV